MKKGNKILLIIITFLSYNSVNSQNFHIRKDFFNQNKSFYYINNVQDIHISFKEKNWAHILDSLFINYGDTGRLSGDIYINDKFIKNVDIRYKGYSSWSATETKTPFNIDMNNIIKHQNYKGFYKLKLSNVIHDPSFVREALGYYIARKYLPEPEANFSNLYINDVLIGLYSNVEAIDKYFIKKYFPFNENTLIKGSPEKLIYPFGQNANLAYTHGPDSSAYIPFYKLESDYGWKDLFHFIDILNNDIDNIESVLNVDRTLWMHAFNYALLNLDSYIGYSQNYYLYKDNNGRFNPIIWDLNMSFGSFRNTDGTSLSLSIQKIEQLDPLEYENAKSFSPRPLLKNLFQTASYRKMFIAHLRTIINENISNNEYLVLGQQLQNIIDKYVVNDTNKFYTYDDFKKNLNYTTGTSSDLYPGLKELMEARVSYLEKYPGFKGQPVISEINHYPLIPDKKEDLNISCKVKYTTNVILAYRLKSFDIFSKIVMYDDGIHNDGVAGDNIYGANIKLIGNTVQFYIYAENDTAGSFSPEKAEYEYYTVQPKIHQGDLVINEIKAKEGTFSNYGQEIYSSEQGKKWIEFFNNTDENIYLNDMYLSDNKNNLTKWHLPDTVIKSYDYIIVWADNNTRSKMHSDLKLNCIEGNIFLSDSFNNIIDSVYYKEQISYKTYGRFPNGYGNFTFMFPSFSTYNYSSSIAEDNFILYPNPVTDNKIYLEIENNNKDITIEITNSKGQSVYKEEITTNKNYISAIIKEYDLSAYTNGLYFIKIICSDNVSRVC